jgi:biopolymer transport protein ExbD
MIDVMMFLLVFFVLISINVLPALGLRIKPPTSARPDQIADRLRITVSLDREGKSYVDGEPVALPDLAGRLAKAADPTKKLSVIIAGDEGATMQNLVGVLDALKLAGVASAQIVTRGASK